MKKPLEDVLRDACQRAIKGGELVTTTLPPLFLSVPTEAEYGDLACDVALNLARVEGRHPFAVADTIVRHIDDPGSMLANVSVAGPGFINFRFAPAYWWSCLAAIEAAGESYGRSAVDGVTPVSPVAMLDLSQARAVVLGNVLARLLAATGQRAEGAFGDVAPVRVRRHELVTWGQLVERIGADGARFFLAMGRADEVLDLDLDVAERGTAENPFFYLRYALDRLAGLARSAAEIGLGPGSSGTADIRRLDAEAELGLIRSLADLPETVELAASRREPHRVVDYLTALAADFHRYYNRNRILGEDRELGRARLLLAANVRKVMRVGLELLGVTVPDTM